MAPAKGASSLDLNICLPLLIGMQTNILTNVSLQQLKQIVAIREQIEGLEQELDRIVGRELSAPATTTSRPRKKRRLSAAGRARLSAIMKARWASRRKGKSLRD